MSSRVYDSTSSPPPPSPGAREHAAPPFGAAGPTAVPPPPRPAQADGSEDGGSNPAVEAFHRIKRDVDELKEYASYYVAAKVDGVKQTVRNIGLYAALGVLGLIAGGAIIATAAGLLIVGLAEGLGRLFGDRYWLGDIVAGVVVLAVIGAGAWYMMNRLTGTWRSQTLKKYEQRKQSQRERFGHDLSQRAAEAGAADRRAPGR